MWYQRFLKWLEVRPSGRELVSLVTWMSIAYVGLSIGVGIMLSVATFLTSAESVQVVTHPHPLTVQLTENPGKAVTLLLFAAFGEELLFRFVPIAGVFIYARSKRNIYRFVVPVLILSNVGFGLIHLTNYASLTWMSATSLVILFCGRGLLLGALFLKYTGLHRVYAIDAFLLTTFVHFVWNLSALCASALVQ